MLETRAQAMANKKIENLEKKLAYFQILVDQMQKFMDAFKRISSWLHSEAHGFNEDHEGGSSHHIHFHGNHQHSHPRPPMLDMYKFDGSNLAVWVAQMDQYFTLDETKLRVGGLYLD